MGWVTWAPDRGGYCAHLSLPQKRTGISTEIKTVHLSFSYYRTSSYLHRLLLEKSIVNATWIGWIPNANETVRVLAASGRLCNNHVMFF